MSHRACSLDVYEDALRAIVEAERVASQIPWVHRHLAHQLRKSSTSIALNIAEGADEFRFAEKARLYRIARRSASETLSNFDILELVMPNAPDMSGARSAAAEVRRLIDNLVRTMDRKALDRRIPARSPRGPGAQD